MEKKKYSLLLILSLFLILPSFLRAQDVGVYAIISPQTGDCGTTKVQVIVQIINYDTSKSATGFPVAVSISGSASFSAVDTFVNTIKPGDTANFTISTTINSSSGGTYNVKAYTEMKGDTNHSNDTMTSQAVIAALPAAPSTLGGSRCGFGQVTLTSKLNASSGTDYWYADTTSGTPVLRGDTFLTPYLSSTTTYYSSTAIPQKDTANTYLGGSRTNNGNMFNVTALDNFHLDSFGINCEDGNSLVTEVYYKLGTYQGYETKSSAWTLLGKLTIAGVGINKFTNCPIGGLNMVKGQKYGFYVVRQNGSSTDGLSYNLDSFVLTKPDMEIQSGCSIGGLFGSVVHDRAWSGRIYYSKPGCSSAYVPTVATIKQGVNGVSLKKDSIFNGYYSLGEYNFPDQVCQNYTSIYKITPPKGLSDSGFGTTWTIKFDTLRTEGGKIFKDTAFIAPTDSTNGLLEMFPDSAIVNDELVLKGTATDLTTGCDSSFTRYIVFAPRPYAAFTVSNSCQEGTTTFTNKTTLTTGSLTYLWNFGDGGTSKDASPVYTYKKSGTFRVKLTAYTPSGCMDTAITMLTVHPEVSLNPVIVGGCPGLTTFFIDSSTLSSGTYNAVWNFGDGDSSTSNNATHTYAKEGSDTVKFYTITNFGCSDSTSLALKVVPGPVSHFSVGNLCQNEGTVFSNGTTVAGGGHVQSSLWRFGDFTTSSLASPTHNYGNAGTYNVTLISTSATGCMDSISHSVIITDRPLAKYSYVGGCASLPVYFNDSSSIADGSTLTYSWAFGDKSVSTLASPFHKYADTGSYVAQLIVSSGKGCVDTSSQTIQISPSATAGFSTSDVCLGTPAFFSNSTTPSTGATYSWNFGDNSKTVDSANPSYRYAKAGAYKVVLTASIGTCSDTFSQFINVFPDAVAGFTYTSNKDTVSFKSKDPTQMTYGWNFGDGTKSSLPNPSHTYAAHSNKYPVTLVVTNADGCVASQTDTVAISVTGIEKVNAPDINLQVYPNPFQNTTAINYKLENAAQVKVEVYDMTGRQVALLANTKQAPGAYSFTFDAEKYNAGPGVYLLKVSIDNGLVNQEVIRIK